MLDQGSKDQTAIEMKCGDDGEEDNIFLFD